DGTRAIAHEAEARRARDEGDRGGDPLRRRETLPRARLRGDVDPGDTSRFATIGRAGVSALQLEGRHLPRVPRDALPATNVVALERPACRAARGCLRRVAALCRESEDR